MEPTPKTTDEQVAEFIKWSANTLRVPFGLLMSKPYVIEEWQTKWLAGALEANCLESFLSVARKNGKTGLIAAILLCYLIGPWNRKQWRGIVTSLTGLLAKELRTQMEETAKASNLLHVGGSLKFLKSPTPGRAIGKNGASVDFLAADKATGHAIGADLALIDEAGLLQENNRSLWNALLSCVSGRAGKLWCISIKGRGPMFAELLSRAHEDDPDVYGVEYSCSPDASLDDPTAWAASNPGLGTIKDLQHMVRTSRRALATPSNQADFRAYELNLPQDPSREMICSVADWQAITQLEIPPRSGPCVMGFDLGTSNSMCASVPFWPETGRMEIYAAFPDTPDLEARGKGDGVGKLYQTWHAAGELWTYPNTVTTPIAQFIQDVHERVHQDLKAVGADGHRRREMEQALIDAQLRWKITPRGMGSASSPDAGHDIRAFQRALLNRQMVPAHQLLMEQAISESAVVRDTEQRIKLDKSRFNGRIDVLQAAVIATGLAELKPKAPGGGYHGSVRRTD